MILTPRLVVFGKGRSSALDGIQGEPEGSEVRLQSAKRAAAGPAEGCFLALPEISLVDAFLTRVLNRQVRDFIRNGENVSVLEVLNQIVANSRIGRTRRDLEVPLGGPLEILTPGIRENQGGRHRPRRDEDRDRRRNDVRDCRGDDSLDRRRSERGRDKSRARGGRDRRRRDDSR